MKNSGGPKRSANLATIGDRNVITLRRLAALGLIALALVLCASGTAWPHAALLDAAPADGEALQSAPHEVVLRFNEPVSPIRVRVIAPGGGDIAQASVSSNAGTEIRIALPDGLGRGSYVVSYRVTSADSHPVAGAVMFSVGSASAPHASIDTAQHDWKVVSIAIQAVHFLALLLAAGGALFRQFVARGTARAHARPPAFGLLVLIATASGVAAIGLQGAALVDAAPGQLLTSEVWRAGMSSTRALGVATTLLGLLVLAAGSARGASFVVAAGVVCAVAGLSLTGHAQIVHPRALAVVLYAVHTLCAAYWIGALLPLFNVVRHAPPSDAAATLRRFSNIACVAVAALVVAGTLFAALVLDRPGDLLTSDYGRILSAKIALVALLLALAAYNRWRLTPRIERGDASSAARLLRTMGSELALATIVVALTAMLGNTPPPASTLSRAAHVDDARPAAHIEVRGAGLVARVAVTPALRGRNRLDIALFDDAGAPLDAQEASVTFELPAAGIEAITRQAVRVAPGRFVLDGQDLPLAGEWSLRIDALLTAFDRVSLQARFTVAGAARDNRTAVDGR